MIQSLKKVYWVEGGGRPNLVNIPGPDLGVLNQTCPGTRPAPDLDLIWDLTWNLSLTTKEGYFLGHPVDQVTVPDHINISVYSQSQWHFVFRFHIHILLASIDQRGHLSSKRGME